MKRKSLTKVISLVLASAMVLSLAACGGKEEATNNASSEAPKTEAASSEAPAKEEAPKETQTISFSVIDLNAGNNNKGDYAEQILQTIQEYCGVNVDLQWVANDALAEKNSLYLASPKTMPQM